MIFLLPRRLSALIFVGLAIFVSAGSSIAQEVIRASDHDLQLRRYINERWLMGSAQRMSEEFELTFSLGPIRNYELVTKKVLSPELKAKIALGIKAKQREMSLSPLTPIDTQVQFDRWGSCISSSYLSKLGPEKMGELRRYMASETYRFFPSISKAVEDWPFVAMKRQSTGEGALFTRASIERLKNEKGQLEQMKHLQGVYLSISNTLGILLQIQSTLGDQVYRAILGELMFMSLDLPTLAKATGVSDQQWTEIERYAVSDLASEEDKLYRVCLANESYLTGPMRIWMTGMGNATMGYFEENKSIFLN